MANKIVASSLDNFVLLNNSHSVDAPYVTFTVGSPTDVTIKIKDALNEDGYSKEIVGNASAVTSSESFSISGVPTINLMECIKLNSIFFDVQLQSANVIKAKIDTSIKYSITVTGSGVVVGGSYSSFNPTTPNKMVMMLQGTINGEMTNVSMEKYNNGSTVSFNMTAPFTHANFRYPLSVNVLAYQVYNNVSSMVTVPYDSMIVMPTTLTKFQSVDYDTDWYYGSAKVKFLTKNDVRYYNYGEHFALSVLSDDSNLSLKKSYYTNSGVFLESVTSCEYSEKNSIRTDFYDTLDLSTIELRYGTHVGYVMVTAVSGGTEITFPIKFVVNPACKGNNEIFFINEIGGVDSFNFTGTKVVTRKIDGLSTYYKNPIKPFEDMMEIETVKLKTNKTVISLSTKQINKRTAEWLNELNKSKCAYLYLGTVNPKFKGIIVTDFNIETNNNDDEFEVTLEYRDSDNQLTI